MFSGRWTIFAPLIVVALTLKLLGYSYDDIGAVLCGTIATIALGIAWMYYPRKRRF